MIRLHTTMYQLSIFCLLGDLLIIVRNGGYTGDPIFTLMDLGFVLFFAAFAVPQLDRAYVLYNEKMNSENNHTYDWEEQ